MTPQDWALAVLLIAFLGALTYATTRLLDEHAEAKAHRARMADDAYWATLMRSVTRARCDIDA